MVFQQDFGMQFGQWTILQISGRTKKGENLYKCQCSCGTVHQHRLSTLKSKKSVRCKSCYTKESNIKYDLVGKQFGYWTVIDKTKNSERNEWYYHCLCKCGTKKYIAGHHLKSGSSSKCHRCRNKTHGMSQTTTFGIWDGMLRRCFKSNFKAYKYYGGRGITVCNSWLKFENFFKDMGLRPKGLQIDRIDNDGNYEPGNCRWVTPKENNLNRNVLINKKGN